MQFLGAIFFYQDSANCVVYLEMEDDEVTEDGLSEEQIVDRCYVFIMSDDMSNVKLASQILINLI